MNLTSYVLSLARARTPGERIRCLQGAAYDRRFSADQQTELRALVDEARRAPATATHALRPVLSPSDVCKSLLPLKAGAKPLLSPEHAAVVDEWIEGWEAENLLKEGGVAPPGPLLLSGPTGCGKTMLAAYIAARLSGIRSAVTMEGHKLVDSHLGATSANLNAAFEAAQSNSGLLVIEEIDAFAETRSSHGSSADRENNRISIGMMRLIEASSIPIVATTNRPDALDSALRRRFEYRLEFSAPDVVARRMILTELLGAPAPEELVALSLTESVPRVARIKRLSALRAIDLATACRLVAA